MTLDKATREAIAQSVRKAMTEAQETYQEQWVKGEELCREFGFFTPQWLKMYGHLLPRECVRVTDEKGTVHRTGWAYPKKKLLRMVKEGELRMLLYREKVRTEFLDGSDEGECVRVNERKIK